MLPIRNLTGDTVLVNNITQVKRSRKVNGEKVLTFLAVPDDKDEQAWEFVQNESVVNFSGLEYIIKNNKEKSVGNRSIKQVTAVQTFFNTMINCYQYDVFTGSQTFFGALTRVFAPTPYTFSIIDSFTANLFENFGRDNCLSLFQTVLERYGAEFEVVGSIVYLKRQIGVDTGFQMRWKYNITALSKDVDTKNLATVIRGFGGQPDEETGIYPIEREYRSNVEIFGELHAQAIYDERITTIAGMDERLQRELIDEPLLSITVDIAEIRDSEGNPLEVINEGDRGFIIYEPMNIIVEARVVEIDEEFKLIEGKWVKVKTNVTLSNIKKRLTDKTTRFAQTSKKVDRLFSGQEGLPYNVLPEAVRLAAEAINNSLTEIQYPPGQGIVLQDPADPNKMIRLTSAGIGLSDDGGATYRTAMTGAGIVTNELVAGIIRTNNIQIVGEDDLFFWDGSGLYAYNPSDLTKYVRLNSDGLYIAKGAFSLERPDGFAIINNGMSVYDLNIQSHDPPFNSSSVEHIGYFWRTNSEITQDCNFYTFEHKSRYLKLGLVFYAQAGGTCTVTIERGSVGMGNNEVLATVSTTSTDPLNATTVTVDLGVPTGNRDSIYIRVKTSNAAYYAYVRSPRRWLEG